MAVADVLRTCALFKGFTETGITILASVAVERTFPSGSPLFVENMVGDALLIIEQGEVRLSAKGASGEDVPLGVLRAGDSLGELTLITQSQRMCTATARTHVRAVEIRHGDFQRLLQTKPQACLKLLMNIVGDFGQKLQANRESMRSLLGRN